MGYQVHFYRVNYHPFFSAMLCGLGGCSLNSLENHKFNMSVKAIEVEMDKNAWLFLFCVKFGANWFLQQLLDTHFANF